MTDAEDIKELIQKVSALTGEAGANLVGLSKQTRRNRRMIIMVAVLSIVTIVLTFVVSGALIISRQNTERIQQVTTRLDESQTTQRQKALCPLYTILLAADTPAAREASKDKQTYDKDFAVIREGYTALECADFSGGAPTLGSNH